MTAAAAVLAALSAPDVWLWSCLPPVAHVAVIGLTRLSGHDVAGADAEKVRDVALALVGMIISNVAMILIMPAGSWSLLRVLYGMFILDTVEYWVHRYMHINKWLYRHTHQTHHMPKVCGILALYNSAAEAIPFGCLIALSFWLSGVTWLDFVLVTTLGNMKTAWDHASERRGHHHELHHSKPFGNFEQPFFDIWDRLLDTKVWPSQQK
eukprot:TRINITY_DN1067_c0_g1_i1.p1 TRINITY_DN1067_c0_g1~~TRINITY_DN1067_c0_g1_i1.p1  ORF type:complete len:209 (+),score=33.03 TRINITY_DN1067_c0_g1_i1:67-693(+)